MSSQSIPHHFPVLACAFGAILFGFIWYPLRLLEQMGLPGLWSSLIIYCVAMFFMLPFCWRERAEFLQHKLHYILIGLSAGWANLAFILAVLEGEVVRTLLLFHLSPIWANLLALFILGEHLTRVGLCSLILAMLGSALILWRPELSFSQGIGLADFYAITAGMAFAITNIVSRKMGSTPINLKMGACCIGVVVLTLCALVIVQLPPPNITFNAGILALLTGFPFMLTMIWTSRYGATYLPIQLSSIIFLLELVVGAVSAAYLTDEIVRNIEYIGGILIISAGLISLIKGNERTITS